MDTLIGSNSAFVLLQFVKNNKVSKYTKNIMEEES